jgi:hypothetical protein
MSNRILSFKEFVRVNESDNDPGTKTVGVNDEIMEKMVDTLFREGGNSSPFMQDEFNILATLFNTEITNPREDFTEYANGSTFDHSVWSTVYPKVYAIGAKSNPVNLAAAEVEKKTFIMLNNYLYYKYPKKTVMINTYGGEGKLYPKLNSNSFDNLARLLRDMGLTGDAVFGKYWKNYSDYKYSGLSI